MANLLILVFLSLLASQDLLAEGVQTSADIAYLQSFAAATGAGQALGWTAGSDPCDASWSGVFCNSGGKVMIIDIQGKGLLGTVPDTAGNDSLSSLKELHLGGNAFTGTLPLLHFPQLRTLGLDGNLFTTMPAQFFTGIQGIQEFNISNNTMLAGWQLSDDIRSLNMLYSFQASDAGINGSFNVLFINSTEGFPFPDLALVSMADNQLSGTVPDIEGSKIRRLDLSNNLLTGSTNFITGLASSAEHIQLSHNKFTGALPDFSGFTDLFLLSVDHNQITGIVPSSLPRLPAIFYVSLTGNMLQGPLPEFSSLVHTDVAKAAAAGSFCRIDRGRCDPEVESLLLIAGALGYPKIFAANWLRNDACDGWVGVHCDDRRRVTGINLSRLGLSGTMDSAFGSLTSLEAILLSGNNIFGEVPASVAQLPNLRVLDVSNNDLDGTTPKFHQEVAVWIEGNPRLKLSGSSFSVPSTLGFWVTLVVTAILSGLAQLGLSVCH